MQAERALKDCKLRLSVRKKLSAHSEHALKKTVKTEKKFAHTEPALKNCLCRLSMRKKIAYAG